MKQGKGNDFSKVNGTFLANSAKLDHRRTFRVSKAKFIGVKKSEPLFTFAS